MYNECRSRVDFLPILRELKYLKVNLVTLLCVRHKAYDLVLVQQVLN